MAKRATSRTGDAATGKKAGKKASKKATTSGGRPGGRASGRRAGGLGVKAGDAKGKHLVIVESPSKAKTINKYLGSDYLVLASVGHVRDLPQKAKKGEKRPVPGVDLDRRFEPSYEVLPGKEQVIRELKRAASETLGSGREVWFATDLDREGEAIAWHLAEELGIDPREAKRVVFAAITKGEIAKAFSNPHAIDLDKVNAQQARRILDRIVGYQVSPLLWKKVARGLSAGRVQSVAVRVIVEREREIRAFVPEEYWQIAANFALSEGDARKLGPAWRELLAERDEKGNPPTVKAQNAWLADHGVIRAELAEIAGRKFDVRSGARAGSTDWPDLTGRVREIVEACGLRNVRTSERADDKAKGPARTIRTIEGEADPARAFEISSIETKRTSVRPPAPFITSTLQQAASSRLGFGAQRTMRAAQALYEGVDIPGEGPVGLITYMRTDSTHISGEALSMVREHVGRTYGDAYLPEKPNFFSSSNKAAQEAHEAIRPTSMAFMPAKVKNALKPDQLRLYTLIWERFVACQMTPAQWDSTTALIRTDAGSVGELVFRASGRVLAFDGFYKVAGVPVSDSTQTLPKLEEKQRLHAVSIDPQQKFTSPPSRFTEASLIKTLESEGIGRPSTYASIIQTIQDRKYVEQINRALYATDLGEVVTDKLIEAFPRILDVGYTREMEGELDKVEEEHLDWIDMLSRFYAPFKQSLERAHDELSHAKAEIVPAPEEYRCEKCGSSLVYRFGRNGRFLSCSTYPDCNYACPCDRDGRPMLAQFVNVRCPRTGQAMVLKNGRFGPFLTTALAEGQTPDDGIILNLDKKRHVTAPSPPALETELPCPTCEAPLNLRDGVRGPWLGCSRFPKCRGRGKWTELDDAVREALEKELAEQARAHPIPIIATLDGRALTNDKGKPLPDAPTVDDLMIDQDEAERLADSSSRTPAGSAA